MSDDIGERIRAYIATEIMFEDNPSAVADDTPLLGSLVDSLGLVQLVAFIEGEFDITVEDTEVTADNFRTVADIERLIAGKVQSG